MTMQKRSVWRLAINGLAVAVTLSVPILALLLFGSNARALLSDRGVGNELGILGPVEPQAKAPKAGLTPRSDDQTVVELANFEYTRGPKPTEHQ